ncbi:DUF1656 domain-containing protein [Acidisoma sp. C75]
MFVEAQTAGLFYAPIVLYCLIAAVIFLPLRAILGRIGFFSLVWHPALFEVALYALITGAIVLLLA